MCKHKLKISLGDNVTSRVDGPVKKRLNSIIILREELHLWGLAGARGVTHILAQLPAG